MKSRCVRTAVFVFGVVQSASVVAALVLTSSGELIRWVAPGLVAVPAFGYWAQRGRA